MKLRILFFLNQSNMLKLAAKLILNSNKKGTTKNCSAFPLNENN